MFNKLKNIITGSKQKDKLQNIKKVTNTADSIISKAVSNAGNISNITLSKDEQKALLEQRKKIPFYIIVMKYSSIGLFAISLCGTLFINADLDINNSYFGALGLQDNTGSLFQKLKTQNNRLKEEVEATEASIEDFKSRIETGNYGIFTNEVATIQKKQKHWFTSSEIVTNLENGESEVETNYGLIDAVNEMVEFFQDANYQIKYFAKKEKELLGDKWEICKNPYVTAAKKAELKCPPPIMIAMKNEITIRSININSTGANISVNVSDILSKVFTLGSEFVDMMNSFPFYRDGSIRSFTRRQNPTGEESMEISLSLELQKSVPENEENPNPDPADQYFQYFENWRNLNQTINKSLDRNNQAPTTETTRNSAPNRSRTPRTNTRQ